MKIIAEKSVLEMSEGNIVACKSLFEVKEGETVEALMKRLRLDGTSNWHFVQAEVKLKLVQ